MLGIEEMLKKPFVWNWNERYCFSLRPGARLHEVRSEPKPVWDFTLMWGTLIINVHMTSAWMKLSSVQILLRWNWPKWNFKPHWVFYVNSKCP